PGIGKPRFFACQCSGETSGLTAQQKLPIHSLFIHPVIVEAVGLWAGGGFLPAVHIPTAWGRFVCFGRSAFQLKGSSEGTLWRLPVGRSFGYGAGTVSRPW